MMNNLKILFSYKPTRILNSKISKKIMILFQDIHKNGTAILLVSHDVEVAYKTQRVVFLKDRNIT